VFATAVPDWRVGDEFRAAGLVRFRIRAIEPEMNDDAPWHAVWVVEPV
jgi:hypothetical protein